MTETVGNPSGTLGADDRAAPRRRRAHRRRRPGRPLRRLLRGVPRALGRPWSTRCPSWAARSPRCTRRRTSSTSPASRSSRARALVEGLVEQAATAKPTYLLDRTAATLVSDEAAGEVRVGLDDGTTVVAGAVIITAGIGKFTPRALPAAEDWDHGGVAFFVPSFLSTPARTW